MLTNVAVGSITVMRWPSVKTRLVRSRVSVCPLLPGTDTGAEKASDMAEDGLSSKCYFQLPIYSNLTSPNLI